MEGYSQQERGSTGPLELSRSRETAQAPGVFLEPSFTCLHTTGLASMASPPRRRSKNSLMSWSPSSSTDFNGSPVGHPAPCPGFYPQGLPSKFSGLRKETNREGQPMHSLNTTIQRSGKQIQPQKVIQNEFHHNSVVV